MIDFLNSVKSLIKLEKIHTDSHIFKLHYKFTVILLIVFSILLTSKQYFGDPIKCQLEKDDRNSVIETYCWISGTHILMSSLTAKSPLSGLGNYAHHPVGKIIETDEIKVQKYYQWVCIVYCFQALLFYIPRYLWKTWESGRMRLLVKDLGGPLISSSWNPISKERLVNYFLSGHYTHNCYAIRFAICELLNLINVVAQIFLMDWFLSGNFTTYGIAIASFITNSDSDMVNPMSRIFPKITKCSFHKFGPSGNIENRDALCVLPLNIVNEKLFMFLWFWFCILTILSIYEMFYRIVVLLSKTVRMYLLMAQANYLSRKNAHLIVHKMSFGDVFILSLLGKNLNPLIYKELLTAIAASFGEKPLIKGYETDITITV